MQFALAKLSTKGQIVIPKSMRQDMKPGDDFLLIKEKKNIVLKNMKALDEKTREDLIFSQRVDEALERYDRGEYRRFTEKEFLKELEKWSR